MNRFIVIVFIALVFMISACSNPNSQLPKGLITKVNGESTNEIVNNQDSLALLNIVLPKDWKLDKSENAVYKFLDENGENRGTVSAINYMDNFNFLTQMPNHSSVTNNEYIDLPLGKSGLITLDSDNGTAASGIAGTHDTYYASLPIKGKAIYMLNFTKNDKKPETKSQFIEILNKLSLK
ncbi:hypothetical protein [Paenibacillus radicis (ex Xue et al. 2023)]|uniref:Lipoprotein n=1 Tax=Paenibacillus radicis (ex Xue et al. 2023) TaxID=2972489 RepID=A0ABT1YFQ7_9BACL|nr:hypothetical protein [Paenibacillus radicis (ex Xue et al. 2023)]MCR8632032.1 hypothetical protein [Paenibacillus radicis (ex Xue et al. 2023)]